MKIVYIVIGVWNVAAWLCRRCEHVFISLGASGLRLMTIF